jgi:DNA/RNA endonuclease YhcR with UshA esterase domain
MNVASVWRMSAIVGALALFSAPWALTELRGQARAEGSRYDASTEVTVRGTVQQIQQGRSLVRGQRMNGSIHVVLQTSSGTLDVRLGPKEFLSAQDLVLTKGEHLRVTGSKIIADGQEAVIARIVEQGEKTFTLRDARGVPKWAHRRTN